MKRFLTTFLCFFVIIICCSCSVDPPIIDDAGEERFLYAATWGGRIIRYDVIDRRASVACPDPQCKHGEDCPVTLVERLTVSDDYLLYVHGELAGDVYCYNLRLGTIDKIISVAQASALYLINKTVYFSASQYEYNDDGSIRGEVWNVYKYDIDSKQLTRLNDEALAASVSVERHTEDTIIWKSMDKTRFSSDYDFKNIIANLPPQPQVVGDYTYKAASHYHEGMYIYKVERSNNIDNTTELVQDRILSFRWDNPKSPKRMIYIPLNEDALYSIDLTTMNNSKLCDIPKGTSVTDIFVVQGNDYMVGNFIAFHVYSTGSKDDEEKLTSESLMFVNVTNGEHFIITP